MKLLCLFGHKWRRLSCMACMMEGPRPYECPDWMECDRCGVTRAMDEDDNCPFGVCDRAIGSWCRCRDKGIKWRHKKE